MQLGNKADLLEIGKVKMGDSRRAEALSQNDIPSPPPAPVSTRKEIAKALAITFGTSTHPSIKSTLMNRSEPMMMFLVEVTNRMMKQSSLADVTDYMATIHDPSQLEPWEYLEPLNDEGEDDRTEIINRLFGIIFPEVSRQPKKIMEISFRRFCALVYIIAPDKLGSTSQVEISNELGFTSAGFSKLCIELSVKLGIQPRSLRTIGTRKHPSEDGTDTRKRTSRAERDGKMLNDARIFFDKGKNWLSHHKVILKRKGYLNDDGKLTRAGIDWIGEQEEL